MPYPKKYTPREKAAMKKAPAWVKKAAAAQKKQGMQRKATKKK